MKNKRLLLILLKRNVFIMLAGIFSITLSLKAQPLNSENMFQHSIQQVIRNQQILPEPLEDFQVNENVGECNHLDCAIAMDNIGNYVIVWEDYRNVKSYIFGRRFNPNGQPLDSSFQVSRGVWSGAEDPDIAMDGNGNFVITWNLLKPRGNLNHDVLAQRYDYNGNPLGEIFMVHDDGCTGEFPWGCPQGGAAIVIDDKGNFVITWVDLRENRGIYAQRYNSYGNKLGENLKADLDAEGTSWQIHSAIAASESGNFVVTWQDLRFDHQGDIYIQRYDANGQTLDVNSVINDDTQCSEQDFPDIEIDVQGNYVVVWQDGRYGNSDIYGQRFDYNGILQESNFKINDDASNRKQEYPSIGLDSTGNFVVVWQDNRSGNYDIYGQRYNSNGISQSSNFKIKENGGSNAQYCPDIVVNSDGSFVVVWQDSRNGNYDIYGQRYDNKGTPIDANFKIDNDNGSSDQEYPAISMDENGAFIVVWQDKRNGNYDIYGQRYSSSGVHQNVNFKISDYTQSNNQTLPDISTDQNGYFIVVWNDKRNGNWDIFCQFFDNYGNKIGVNYRVDNDVGGNRQERPDVKLINKQIYYTWQDDRIKGQGYDIFARIDNLDSILPDCLLGDVNMDSVITPGDALCAFQIYMNNGIAPPGECDTECALKNSDANCDGSITPGDALIIFQAYLDGLKPPLECPPLTELTKGKIATDFELSLDQVNFATTKEITMSIKLDKPWGLKAFGMDLGYPEELLSFVKVSNTNLTKEWQALDGKEFEPGIVTIGGFDPKAINSKKSGALVTVTFKVKEGIEGRGALWLFNLTDDVTEAGGNSAEFSTNVNEVRRIGDLAVPTTFNLEQNYPNPFNMKTEIVYQLPEARYVNLCIYNSLGQKIRTLVSRTQNVGKYAAHWDGSDEQGHEMTSGVYIYRFETSGFSDVKKMLLMK